MAFGFFRRRQKMVIIIMVVLMVSFLVGYQGFELLFHRNQDPVIGRMADEKITKSIFIAADGDVKTMEKLEPRAMENLDSKTRDLLMAFLTLRGENPVEHDVALAFALLQIEAQKAKIRVSESEVDASIDKLAVAWDIKSLPDGSVDRDSFYAALRDIQISKPNVRSAIAHWLMIYKNFDANQPRVPPSLAELRHLYRDTQEKIAVRLAILKAADFLDKVHEPGDGDLQTLFKQHQDSGEGQVSANNDFGFGYRQPDRASVQYLLLRDSVVERGSQPTDQQIKQYYLDHQSTYERKKQQLSDVKEEIADTLRDRVVKTHADSVLAEAGTLITAALGNDASKVTGNVYEDVRLGMMHTTEDVDKILATPLKDVHLDGTVKQVVNELARQAELSAIVYPCDVPGEVNIGSGLHVTLDEAQTTLGDALQKITDKAMGPQGPASTASSKAAEAPKIVWKMCKGFEGVIFPVGPGNLDLFPLKAGETGLKSAKEMIEDPIVGFASAGARGAPPRLLQLVFTSPFFTANNPKPSTLNLGSAGPQMVSNTMDKETGRLEPQGTLLWRLAQAKGAYVPRVEDLQTDPALRAKVVKDWKDREAYGLALEEAKKIAEDAKKRNLEVALKEDETAKKLKLKTQETKPFARKVLDSPQSMAKYMGGSLAQILSQPPLEVRYGNPGADLGLGDSEDSVRQFIDAAFALAPANVEPPYKDKAPVRMTELKLPREVVVMERSDFVPAVLGEFESPNPTAMSASTLKMIMVAQREWEAQRRWFFLGPATDAAGNVFGIAARTVYQREPGQ